MRDLDTRRRSRLLYRSVHRGCKEMDILLGSFAQRHLHLLSEEQLARYEEITELDDGLLYAYIVGRAAIPEGIDRDLIRLIAGYAGRKGETGVV
ncbi:succinate dehydrogenase assembly factor 2 [Candidatus Anaplasma sp. TIGMIC]|uniref:FAD assembly factor SdhE n=1 Tax=Candidatus Anaplasma sp. TIGMIC TaxID=3020713 RepID=UPI00232B9689|nr:succinate dehydrogenase assembly factor 2 [Candidatus Anaplasma sp. TIGMIC]MDB1135316.1 succinate dehydrogenase assembly factor 2 [Candidatus Anaplasma sp. TIGMIC]